MTLRKFLLIAILPPAVIISYVSTLVREVRLAFGYAKNAACQEIEAARLMWKGTLK